MEIDNLLGDREALAAKAEDILGDNSQVIPSPLGEQRICKLNNLVWRQVSEILERSAFYTVRKEFLEKASIDFVAGPVAGKAGMLRKWIQDALVMEDAYKLELEARNSFPETVGTDLEARECQIIEVLAFEIASEIRAEVSFTDLRVLKALGRHYLSRLLSQTDSAPHSPKLQAQG